VAADGASVASYDNGYFCVDQFFTVGWVGRVTVNRPTGLEQNVVTEKLSTPLQEMSERLPICGRASS